jgi:phosphoribosylformylglycinamidine (FGAM) synthase PurS component
METDTVMDIVIGKYMEMDVETETDKDKDKNMVKDRTWKGN